MGHMMRSLGGLTMQFQSATMTMQRRMATWLGVAVVAFGAGFFIYGQKCADPNSFLCLIGMATFIVGMAIFMIAVRNPEPSVGWRGSDDAFGRFAL